MSKVTDECPDGHQGNEHPVPPSPTSEQEEQLVPFGQKRVKPLMEERKWKQSLLGKRTAIDSGTISKIINDKAAPTADHIAKLAAAFGMSTVELVHGTDAVDLARMRPGELSALEAENLQLRQRVAELETKCDKANAAAQEHEQQAQQAHEKLNQMDSAIRKYRLNDAVQKADLVSKDHHIAELEAQLSTLKKVTGWGALAATFGTVLGVANHSDQSDRITELEDKIRQLKNENKRLKAKCDPKKPKGS